jgi:hypothetical protein
MRRLILAICLALAGGSGIGLAAHPALAASLCVGSGPGCFPTIQAALNAAHDGDVIQIGPGTFAGGITIDKSVSLVGAGAKTTIISGGGPVVTIGHQGAPPEPTVSVSGVMVTGGTNSVTPAPYSPSGAGILVPFATSGSPSSCSPFNASECLGATVTVSDSIITGNRAIASASTSCGNGCDLTLPLGGGIANFGTMTLLNTTVSNNTVTDNLNPAPLVKLGFGGGIETTVAASLTLRDSTVSGNTVTVTTADPTVLFVGGGGIDGDGKVNLFDTNITGNTVSVTSSNPDSDIFGDAGGLRFTPTASALIQDTTVTGNSVTAIKAGGGTDVGANASAGGIADNGVIQLKDSLVGYNRVSAAITSAATGTNSATDAGGLEVGDPGTAAIANTRFIGNSVTSSDPQGVVNGGADASGGALALFTGQPVTLTDSIVSGNRITSTATIPPGMASVEGAGIFNCNSPVTLRNTTVSDNVGTTNDPSGGTAQGGGVFNANFCANTPPALTLIDSTVTRNRLAGSPGTILQGGGLYTTAPVTLTNTLIAQNTPDQCFGC